MKWFNSHLLFNINQELMSVCSTERNVFGQIESYVIEKKTSTNNTSSNANGSLSNDVSSINDILPFLPHPNEETFQILKSTMEIAYPDFDFSDTVAEHFRCIQSPEEARSSIGWALSSYFPSATDLSSHMWMSLESEIQPALCDIYSYEPNCTDAFSAMGAVWKMSYFFYNAKMRKILHFHLREGGRDIESLSSDDEIEFEFDLESRYGYSY